MFIRVFQKDAEMAMAVQTRSSGEDDSYMSC